MQRVVATTATIALVEWLTGERGAALFRQSGGGGDGSAPMLFSVNEFIVDSSDLKRMICTSPIWVYRPPY
ncbi:hypothetical protein AWB75_06489 [Caballeronia catudaia]|uniref:Uncharacterized protein n=1 Tax=Caballeronia catudaia TaxID=1777136 RepID=A0A158DDP2_9BURK|nr:DUF779 domain-containing protein [Caballeronia catudaia]SAK91937.1 hypothetical protein AWB75_06489 [Caballeronia catudaia]